MTLEKIFVVPIFRWILTMVVGVIGLGLSSATFAQSLVMPKTIETYLGGNIMFDAESSLEGSGTTGSFDDINVDKARTMMLRWGYREERTYAIELGYMYTSEWNAVSQTNSTTNQKSSGVFADLFFFFPITQEASVYFKMGTARLKTVGTVKVGNTTVSVTQTKWAPSYGLGLEYQLSPDFAVRGGWESLETNAEYFGKSTHQAINVGGILLYQ